MSTPIGYHADIRNQRSGEMEGAGNIVRSLSGSPAVAVRNLRQQRPPKRLWEVIPDDPNYRRHVPIEYRLDAKRIVGYLADDLHRGKLAHTMTEMANLGLVAAEAFNIVAQTSALAAGLAVTGPALALVASFLALGAPYAGAAEEIARDESARGYSRGVVMSADKRSPDQTRQMFGNMFLPPNKAYPAGRKVAKANNHAGLVAGYLHGRVLRENQRRIFWRDLGQRMGDQSYRGPQSQWRSKDWSDWYTTSAAVFRRDHLTS